MSGGLPKCMEQTDDDMHKMLCANVHLGSTNSDYQMLQYVWKRTPTGVHLINLKKTWDKLLLAARVIAQVKNPEDVIATSLHRFGHRAVLKFCVATGCTPVTGRFTPGTFTNQITAQFKEPQLLIVTNPRIDHQPVTEASYANIPVIAFCDADAPMRFVDIAIPCNSRAAHSIGVMWWFLAREVLRLRGVVSRDRPWEIMPDLYFHREAKDMHKEEQEEAAKDEEKAPGFADWDPTVGGASTGLSAAGQVTDWAADTQQWEAEAGTDWGGAAASTQW